MGSLLGVQMEDIQIIPHATSASCSCMSILALSLGS